MGTVGGLFESDSCLGPFQHLPLTDEETEALRTHERCLRSCPRQEKEELRSRRGDDKLKHFEQQSRVAHHTHPHSVPLSMLFLSSQKPLSLLSTQLNPSLRVNGRSTPECVIP